MTPEKPLTLIERADIASMLEHYLMCTDWVDHEPRDITPYQLIELRRKRATAGKIIDAVRESL